MFWQIWPWCFKSTGPANFSLALVCRPWSFISPDSNPPHRNIQQNGRLHQHERHQFPRPHTGHHHLWPDHQERPGAGDKETVHHEPGGLGGLRARGQHGRHGGQAQGGGQHQQVPVCPGQRHLCKIFSFQKFSFLNYTTSRYVPSSYHIIIYNFINKARFNYFYVFVIFT